MSPGLMFRAQMTQVLPVPFPTHTRSGARGNTPSASRLRTERKSASARLLLSDILERPHDHWVNQPLVPMRRRVPVRRRCVSVTSCQVRLAVDGRLFASVGTTAHHIDVGGVRPGTEGPDLEQVYAEGLLLPGVRLYRAGEENPDVFAIVESGVRDPLSTLSDLRAQRAACLTGERRVHELIAKYSPGVVTRAFGQLLDAVEHATRLALAELPDGESEAEGFLDDDGAGGPPTRIHVRLRKQGDRLL